MRFVLPLRKNKEPSPEGHTLTKKKHGVKSRKGDCGTRFDPRVTWRVQARKDDWSTTHGQKEIWSAIMPTESLLKC